MAEHYKKGYLIITAVTLLFFMATGCSSNREVKKDPFFEKWNTMAQTAQGSSPTAKPKTIGTSKVVIMGDKGIQESVSLSTTEGKLPVTKMNLIMRQADIKAVLRTMGRVADQNILVKNDIKGEINVDFRGVPWDQVFRSILRTHGLTYTWEGKVIRVISSEDLESETKRKVQERDTRLVEPLVTALVNIDYADAKLLKDNVQETLTKEKDGKTPRGSVRVDEHSNSLIIQAIRDDISRLLPIIEKIDKPTAQILIKANIVETTKTTARDLGIQWGGMYSTSADRQTLYLTPGGYSNSTTAYTYDPMGGGKPGISSQGFAANFPAANLAAAASGSLGLMFGTLGGNILDMQLSALQTAGKLNILSSPSITTLDNQKAFTENGEKVPYVTTEVTTGATTPSRTVKFEDAVLRLEITPHVVDSNNLKMKILVKKDEVDPSRNVDGNPYIIKKTTETTLIVKDGETIVISGLTKQRLSDSSSGLPWLMDIPVLGWLFKTMGKSEKMEEVLIFITPRILPPQIHTAVTDREKDPQKQGEPSSSGIKDKQKP